jgi:hypothetical protein
MQPRTLQSPTHNICCALPDAHGAELISIANMTQQPQERRQLQHMQCCPQRHSHVVLKL